jgi:hypothetical protein
MTEWLAESRIISRAKYYTWYFIFYSRSGHLATMQIHLLKSIAGFLAAKFNRFIKIFYHLLNRISKSFLASESLIFCVFLCQSICQIEPSKAAQFYEGLNALSAMRMKK